MNWRRGRFQLWIVGSALFVFAVAVISYGEIKAEFDAPSKRFEVRLEDGRTFEVRAPDLQTATAMVRALPEGSVPNKPLLFAATGRHRRALHGAGLLAREHLPYPAAVDKVRRVAALR